MATTRKTSGKTKSAQKPKVNSAATSKSKTTKKTVKKTATRKSTNAIKSVKQSTKKPVKSTSAVKPVKSPLEKLRLWNIATAVFFALQAIAIIVLSNDKTIPLSTSFTTTDSLASLQNEEVLVPAVRVMFDVRLSYVLAAILVVAALFSLIVGMWRRKQYEQDLSVRQNHYRWYGWVLVLGGVTAVTAAVLGIYDKATLALLFGATGVMSLSFLLSERRNEKEFKSKSNFVVGVLAGIAPWLVMGHYVFASWRYGEVLLPSYAIVLAGSMLLLFLAVMYIHRQSVKKSSRWIDYVGVEQAYLLLNIVMLTALTWQVFAGLLR